MIANLNTTLGLRPQETVELVLSLTQRSAQSKYSMQQYNFKQKHRYIYCKLDGFGLGLAKLQVTIGTLQNTNAPSQKTPIIYTIINQDRS